MGTIGETASVAGRNVVKQNMTDDDDRRTRARDNRFRGIIIRMYYDDSSQHHKPHVHVFYGGDEAEVAIDGEILSGRLPQKQYKLLSAWLIIHEDEFYRVWNLAVSNRRFDRIDLLS